MKWRKYQALFILVLNLRQMAIATASLVDISNGESIKVRDFKDAEDKHRAIGGTQRSVSA